MWFMVDIGNINLKYVEESWFWKYNFTLKVEVDKYFETNFFSQSGHVFWNGGSIFFGWTSNLLEFNLISSTIWKSMILLTPLLNYDDSCACQSSNTQKYNLLKKFVDS